MLFIYSKLTNYLQSLHSDDEEARIAFKEALVIRERRNETEKQHMVALQKATQHAIAMETENEQQIVQLSVLKEKIAASQKAAQRAFAMEAENKQQTAQLSILERQVVALETEHQSIYKIQLDVALSSLSAVEERAQMLARELGGVKTYLEMAHEREAILRRNLLVCVVSSMACIVALFAVFVAKLIGPT